ncbi:MAG: PglZ domain-containing protein, partial [Desulfobacterales bacterium]|nr:PglZ domain-containing protein [Desulfobacterales bacterium]
RMPAGLRRRVEKAMADIRARSPETCTPEERLELYTAKNGWHRVDRLHREFEQWTARLKMLTGVTHYRQTTTQIKKCREAYREFVNSLAVLFNRSCGRHGFLPAEDFRQRGFHKRAAAPHLAQGPAAIFYLDAFRYELGAVLAERLAEDKGEVKLSAVFAELPTVTAVGMNALLPIEREGRLHPGFDKNSGKFIGFRSGESIIRGPAQRKKLLKTTVDESCCWLRPRDISDGSPGRLAQKLKNRKLVVVHGLEVDEFGETGLLDLIPDHFENAINRIVSAVRKLQEAGYRQFIFTADHGFLQADETLGGEALPHVETAARRYGLHSFALESSQVVSASFSELNYADDGAEGGASHLVFPVNGDLFHAPGDKDRFYHGGNSPQERITPVVIYKKARAPRYDDSAYRIRIETRPPMMGFHRIVLKTRRKSGAQESIISIKRGAASIGAGGAQGRLGDHRRGEPRDVQGRPDRDPGERVD